MSRNKSTAAETARVVLVRGAQELVVFAGELQDCQAWLALNGDKPAAGEGHFELREDAHRVPPRSP